MELVSEKYWALADKADKKFSRLRDLPPYGGNKWNAYFQKAFQVYTKLWKYQQENRQKLVEAGLKRWEIGEIASRIGQLYYNYYVRTSDATFLSESFIFYEAIMSREYFKDTGKDVALANKHLRYYARFIVVCLLLNRREMVQHLVRQLRMLVDEYRRAFQGNDAKEWKRVVQEIVRFLKADAACQNSRPLRYSVRLDPHPNSFPLVARLGRKSLRLKDAVLVSHYHNEVKFTELTLDTFRFLQCLEWEPSGSLYRARVSDTGSNGSGTGHSGTIRITAIENIVDQTLPPNPHKFILYRPSVPQLLLVLATACDELPADCIMLLYFSASGKAPLSALSPSISEAASTVSLGSDILVPTASDSSEITSANASPAQHGGRGQDATSELHDTSPSSSPAGSPQIHTDHVGDLQYGDSSVNAETGLWLGSRGTKGLSYIFPSDILPFTRRPLFIVVDSDHSCAFEVIHGAERGEPAALLLSPLFQPGSATNSLSYHYNGGSFFTFFLTAPLLAFCRLVDLPISNLSQVACEQAEKLLTSIFSEWGVALSVSMTLNPVWARILLDPFLRQLLVRFILCRTCLALHQQYGNKFLYLPRCLPSLPDEVLPSAPVVEAGLFRLASSLCVLDQFRISVNNLDMPTT
eukprot:c26657_g1_i1 orf=497-2407(+)